MIIIIIIFFMLTSCLITCVLFQWSSALIIFCHACSLLDITYVYLITYYLCLRLCLWSRHDFLYMLFGLNLTIHMCLTMHATWLSPHHSLGSSDSLRPACSDLKTCGFFWLLIWDAQQNRESSAYCLEPYPSRPLWSSLKFSFCNLWASLVLLIFVYLLGFSHLRLSVM